MRRATFFVRYKTYFLFFFLFLLFALHNLLTLDSDFGWHLRTGQLILTSGIPLHDPFSYTMPSYAYIDHAWLTDVGIALLYRVGGLIPIDILFAVITTLALALQVDRHNARWFFIPLLLGGLSLFSFTGVRTQMITLLLFSVLTVILRKQKFLWTLPLLIWLWSSMHGGFAIGLAMIGIYMAVRAIKQRQIFLTDILVFLLCCGVTIVNPYGLHIWHEVLGTANSSALRAQIIEWEPFSSQATIPMLILFPMGMALVMVFRRMFQFTDLLFFAVLTVMSLVSIRHFQLWIIFIVPMMAATFEHLFQLAGKKKDGCQRFWIVYRCFIGCSLFVVLITMPFLYALVHNARTTTFYPDSAIHFLQTHPINGQLFSIYNWGGYLIWQLPNQKVFIDGRMPIWSQSSSPTESENAFTEYTALLNGSDSLVATVQRYHIVAFLLPARKNTMNTQSPSRKFYAELQQLPVQKIYEDQVADIYLVKQ